MLLGRFYFVAFALPIRFQSYWCLSSYCLLAFSGYFHVHLIYKTCYFTFFFIVLGGGGVMLNLVFGSMFLLRGLCSALCFVCYD